MPVHHKVTKGALVLHDRPPVQGNPRAMNESSRADMHCHSTASELSKLGIQRSLSLPECATPPQEVYELAKRRGMDFVTITDHDTIAGVLTLDHLPDAFISEELTVWFKGEPQAVHVLCYGITPDDHESYRHITTTSRRARRTSTETRSRLRSRIPSTPSRHR